MPARTSLNLAKRIDVTERHLIIQTAEARCAIPGEDCSPKLANASQLERSRAILSPSGYSIHWPLIDEDPALGPLIAGLQPAAASTRP
jgi:hypothetical protein